MASKIILKNSSVASRVPNAGDLDLGEVALNTTDGKMFIKKGDGSVVDITGGSSGGGKSIDLMAPNNRLFWRYADTFTWTVPVGVTTIRVVAVGAGGGAGVDSSLQTGGGGGGGGGAYGEGIYNVIEGEVITSIIGAGGDGRSFSPGIGVSGESTSVSGSISGVFITAGGGAGGENGVSKPAATSVGGTLVNKDGGANNGSTDGEAAGTWYNTTQVNNQRSALLPTGGTFLGGWFDIRELVLTDRPSQQEEDGLAYDGEGGFNTLTDLSWRANGGLLAGGAGASNSVYSTAGGNGGGGGSGYYTSTISRQSSNGGDGFVIIYY